MISRVKGTNDFLDLTLYNFALEKLQKHLELYHFTQIMTPLLEPTELFVRSLGTETDVVSKEMFIIKSHAAPRQAQDENAESICLRPEITAPTIRAFIENSVQTVPWKVYSYGPVFRYERPQKGRYRQFHQFNIEVIGSASTSEDVQLIKMLDRFFHETLGINDFAVQINYLGCHEDRLRYKAKLVDFLNGAKATEICDLCRERKVKNPLRVFDCKNPVCQKAYEQAPNLLEFLCQPCHQAWLKVQHELEMLSVSFVVQPKLVRGLDYYNRTVFEFVSAHLGAQNAFCGGGRYDQLVHELGAKEDQPSIGAAIGWERLLLLLEPIKNSLSLPTQPPLYVLVPLAKAQEMVCLMLADELQAQGLCADIVLAGDSVKSVMKKANKMGASFALIVGEQEQNAHQVTVKNMTTGAEEKVAQSELVRHLRK
jgi:histidyl-tRNA synthetase